MVNFVLFAAIGVWLLQQQTTLPDLRWAGLLIPLAAALRFRNNTYIQKICRYIFTIMLAAGCGVFLCGLARSRPAFI